MSSSLEMSFVSACCRRKFYGQKHRLTISRWTRCTLIYSFLLSFVELKFTQTWIILLQLPRNVKNVSNDIRDIGTIYFSIKNKTKQNEAKVSLRIGVLFFHLVTLAPRILIARWLISIYQTQGVWEKGNKQNE